MSTEEYLTGSHVAHGLARAVPSARGLVRGVSLDRLDLAARKHVLDDPDVLVEHDQVARPRHVAVAVRWSAPAALRPRVESVDGAEALAVIAHRHAGLAARPRGKVGAPRTGP